jgi:ParB-like chromosome segregation protein Spo0J
MAETLEQIDLHTYPNVEVAIGEPADYPWNYQDHGEDQLAELAESLTTFGQFKPVVVWRCAADYGDGDKALHNGALYIICGHGLREAARRAGFQKLEAKDVSGISREMAEGMLVVDNAAPLGAVPDAGKLDDLMQRTRTLTADRPRLGAMLERLRERNGIADLASVEFPEYDETIADDVEFIECPECGHKFPK